MKPSTGDIIKLVREVWDTALGLELTPTAADAAPLSNDGEIFVGCIQITGGWTGAVSVRLSQSLARLVATTMLEMAEEELSIEDLNDSIGEITNMTGGNIKGLFPPGCQLSLPSVLSGMNCSVRIPGSTRLADIRFNVSGEPLQVTVLEGLSQEAG